MSYLIYNYDKPPIPKMPKGYPDLPLEYAEHAKSKSSWKKYWDTAFDLLPGALGYVCICENCGAELHATFEYFRPPYWVFRDYRPSGYTGVIYKTVEEAAYADMDDAFLAAKKAYNKSLEEKINCPVCGAKVSQKEGFFLPDEKAEKIFTDFYRDFTEDEHKFRVESRLSLLRKSYDAVNREQANALVSTYSKSCNVFVADAAPQKAGEIKADNEMLRNYILHLIRLENNIYSLEQRLPELYYQRLLNDRAIVLSTHEIRNEALTPLKEKVAEQCRKYQQALDAVVAAKCYVAGFSEKKPSKPNEPVLATPGFFNKKKVLAENEALTAKYQAELKAYQKEVSLYEEKKAQYLAKERAKAIEKAEKEAEKAKADLDAAELLLNEKTSTSKESFVPAMAAKELLDKEITEAETLLQKSYAARNELYAYNVIFGKYRNIVALSSIYEYLMSGRCASLEGADGAYNIFEGEIRADRIIAQLDAVNSSLDQIKQNQYMLYTEMSSVNSSLASLNKTMDEALTSIKNMEVDTKNISKSSDIIAKNAAAIAYNTEVTAYYSKKTAELTNALGYLVAFK